MISVKRPDYFFPMLLAVVAAVPSLPVAAQSGGYYFEFAAGSTESRAEPLLPLTSRSQVTESTLRSNAYTLSGGWRFNDNFAVEVSFTDHGSFSDQAILTDRFVVVELDPVTEEPVSNLVDARLDGDVDYDLQSYGVSLLGNWPFSRRWNAFGRLGITSWKADSKIKGRLTYRGDLERDWNVDGTLSDSSSSFFYGLGLFYRFNRSYAAKLEYQQMRIKSGLFNSDPELESLSFGVRYYF